MIYNNLNLVCNSSNAALVFTSMACNSAMSKVGPSRDRISLIRETKSTSDKEFEINLGNDFSSRTWNISSNNPFSMSSITSHFLGISLLLASLSILIFSDFGISVLNCTNLSFSGLSGYSGIWDFFGIHFSYVSLNNKLCEMCIGQAISHSNRILFKETYVYLLLSILSLQTSDEVVIIELIEDEQQPDFTNEYFPFGEELKIVQCLKCWNIGLFEEIGCDSWEFHPIKHNCNYPKYGGFLCNCEGCIAEGFENQLADAYLERWESNGRSTGCLACLHPNQEFSHDGCAFDRRVLR